MGKSIILAILLLSVILISCSELDVSKISDEDMQRISQHAVICNPPYIRHGTGCCLDINENGICDEDEKQSVDEENLNETNNEQYEDEIHYEEIFWNETPSIAINPGTLREYNMSAGGYAERTVRVLTNEERAIVNIYFENEDNEMNDWVRLEPDKFRFEIGKGNPRNVKVIVEPPIDTPTGNYSTSLIFMMGDTKEFTEITRNFIDTAFGFRIYSNIIDGEIIACNVLSEEITSIETGDNLISKFLIQNFGNVRLNPTINIEIRDKEKSSVEKFIIFDEKTILPTISSEVNVIESSRSLIPGQYFAEISIPECRYTKNVTFDILNPGEISSDGNLIGIRAPAWNNKSDTIVINPVFENTGQRAINAYFDGVIRLDNIMKARITTPTLLVQPKERIEFEAFFSSDEPGRYEVSGRVYYENKRTFEKINRFNILDQYSE